MLESRAREDTNYVIDIGLLRGMGVYSGDLSKLEGELKLLSRLRVKGQGQAATQGLAGGLPDGVQRDVGQLGVAFGG